MFTYFRLDYETCLGSCPVLLTLWSLPRKEIFVVIFSNQFSFWVRLQYFHQWGKVTACKPLSYYECIRVINSLGGYSLENTHSPTNFCGVVLFLLATLACNLSMTGGRSKGTMLVTSVRGLGSLGTSAAEKLETSCIMPTFYEKCTLNFLKGARISSTWTRA